MYEIMLTPHSLAFIHLADQSLRPARALASNVCMRATKQKARRAMDLPKPVDAKHELDFCAVCRVLAVFFVVFFSLYECPAGVSAGKPPAYLLALTPMDRRVLTT